MSAYDDVAQDLAHIRTMILALEHLGVCAAEAALSSDCLL
jgi:hypothetical protein